MTQSRWTHIADLLKKAVSLFWPMTKKKAHRLLHVAGVACTAALMVLAYVLSAKLNLPAYQHLAATLAPLVPLFTKWGVAIAWADSKVDKLPIPDDVPASEAITKPVVVALSPKDPPKAA